jgi:hypothetical protein
MGGSLSSVRLFNAPIAVVLEASHHKRPPLHIPSAIWEANSGLSNYLSIDTKPDITASFWTGHMTRKGRRRLQESNRHGRSTAGSHRSRASFSGPKIILVLSDHRRKDGVSVIQTVLYRRTARLVAAPMLQFIQHNMKSMQAP